MSDQNEPATLTGLAIGDALGMPFETHLHGSEHLRRWDGSFLSGATNTIQPHRKPGEWTDDTKMARALAESLVECGIYDPVHTCTKYVDWYKSGDLRGMGKATREALDRMLKGFHWNRCGVEHAEGNGAAMRAAALGLFYCHDILTVADMTRVDACTTHRSIEAREGAVAVALGVALLATQLADKTNLLDPILNLLRGPEDEPCVSLVETRLIEVQTFLREARSPDAVLSQLLRIGTNAHVVQTVPAAFLCFLATDSFKDAVELAVRAGGDTDTTAAITGALAGTFYGRKQVEPYLSQLEDAEAIQTLDHIMWLEAPHFPDEL